MRTTRMMAVRRPWYRRMYEDNRWLKLASIAIAIALFFVVREDKGKEVDIEVPVVLSNISDQEVFVGEMPKVLRVRVRDRWSRLAKALERKAKPYQVDLRGFSDQTVFVFDPQKIRLLLGVNRLSIQSVYPSEFVVRTEPKLERVVPVYPNFKGDPREGYEIPKNHVKVTPPHVRIWGAKSSVKQVSELLTNPVDLHLLDKDSRIEVQIQKPAYSFLFLDDDRVKLDIPVKVKHGKITLKKQEIGVKGCPAGMVCQVQPSMATVTLSGPVPTLLKIQNNEVPVSLYVDASDYDATVVRHGAVRPACDRPAGVECKLKPRTLNFLILNPEPQEADIADPGP
ncbi:MAG: YbbR-like domain-containing protein [Deltaproteobacteria bacterium]|nr:YbbR-like domain-containing protein [Deltaproteobacteria bacterium]